MNKFFFVKLKRKSVCLVCGDALAVMKKANLECHYSTKHAKLDALKGQVRADKTAALRRNLIGQQVVLSKLRADQDSVTQGSFLVVSELIAKKLIIITAPWHQTSHKGQAVPAIALGHTDMIMIIISKLLFFYLRLTVDNLMMYLKSFQSILMRK